MESCRPHSTSIVSHLLRQQYCEIKTKKRDMVVIHVEERKKKKKQ